MPWALGQQGGDAGQTVSGVCKRDDQLKKVKLQAHLLAAPGPRWVEAQGWGHTLSKRPYSQMSCSRALVLMAMVNRT